MQNPSRVPAPPPRLRPAVGRLLLGRVLVGVLLASACSDTTMTAPAGPAPDAAVGRALAGLPERASTASEVASDFVTSDVVTSDVVAAAGGALMNGATHTGQITLAGQADSWTVAATQGDAITLSAGEMTGTAAFTPWIRLVAPNGTLLGNSWGAVAAQVNVTAPATGTYTVLVASGDAARVGTGSYRLTLVKVPGTFVVSAGDQGGPLGNGANAAGAIPAGDLDAWSFTAAQGDAIALSVGEVVGAATSATFTPWIRLFGPNGALLGNSWGAAAAQINVAAPSAGTYTVVVGTGDAARAGTGDYRLTLARAPGTFVVPLGDDGGVLANGADAAGSIVLGDLDLWRFTAAQGDAIALSVGELSGTTSFTPWVRLVGPNGAILGNSWGAVAAQVNVAAPSAGTYTVIVGTGDAARAGTGSYRVTLAKGPGTFAVSAGDEGGAMTNGARYAGTIATGDLDMWRFTATQGDAIALSVGEVTGSATFTPWIRLVAPNGAILGNSWGAVAAQVNAAAPLTGTYTVIIGTGDAGRAGTGDYRLTLAKAPGAFVVPADDEGGALAFDGTVTGAITRGDLDLWSLTATQGSLITVTVAEVTGSPEFTPWIRLVAPNGTVVGNTWGAAGAQIRVAASLTGTYTVIVGTGDAARAGTGSYRLSR